MGSFSSVPCHTQSLILGLAGQETGREWSSFYQITFTQADVCSFPRTPRISRLRRSMKSSSLAAAKPSVTPLCFTIFPNSLLQAELLNSKREILPRVHAEGEDAKEIFLKQHKIIPLGCISVVSPTHPSFSSYTVCTEGKLLC